jgi:hypothetical protein
MIITKSALQIVNLCAPDKEVPALNCVCVEADGSVVASNSKVWAWVSPLPLDKRKLVPLPGYALGEQVVLTADTVKTILKALPKDTQFKGLLEHVDLEIPEKGKPNIVVHFKDQERMSEVKARRSTLVFPDYKPLFRSAQGGGFNNQAREWICLNRKRLGNICMVMDKVCNYDGSFAPTWWQFTQDGRVVMRAINELNGQRLIAIMSQDENDDLPMTIAESLLLSPAKAKALRK